MPSENPVSESEQTLSEQVLAMCKRRGWSLHWTARGAYLHLESSELIEAVRGKHGDVADEAGDVLIVLMSITENAGIPWATVEERARRKVEDMRTRPTYAGEEVESRAQPARGEAPAPEAKASPPTTPISAAMVERARRWLQHPGWDDGHSHEEVMASFAASEIARAKSPQPDDAAVREAAEEMRRLARSLHCGWTEGAATTLRGLADRLLSAHHSSGIPVELVNKAARKLSSHCGNATAVAEVIRDLEAAIAAHPQQAKQRIKVPSAHNREWELQAHSRSMSGYNFSFARDGFKAAIDMIRRLNPGAEVVEEGQDAAT